MSTEPEGLLSVSNTSITDVVNDQLSETLDDSSSGQNQELEAKRDGDEQHCSVTVEPVSGGLALGCDHVTEKTNGSTNFDKQTEPVNGKLDLAIEILNVDIKTVNSVKHVPVDSETELVVEKEMEPDLVSSHGTNLSEVKGSDVRLDSKDIVENLDFECFEGLEPHESKVESVLDENNVHEKLLLGSDLVWAKVRSHPWWPGQVFDASAATDKATKHFKKGSFLVTYFGDCTFAWNDASRVKPFRQHFSQFAKQSSLPDFVDAIGFALEEVSRRIEFGLACSCISEAVYEKIKAQNIINPGIREDSSSIDGGDKVSGAVFFEPTNLVEYVKRLACSPSYDATDELQFVSQRAKLLAFNHLKGYTDLPEFVTIQGSVESAPKVSLSEEKIGLSEVNITVPEPKKTEQVYTKRRKTEEKDNCKQVFEYEDTIVLKKKEKTLAEIIDEKRLSRSKGNRSDEISVIKPNCEKKRKVVSSKLPKSAKKIKLDMQTEVPGSPVYAENDPTFDSTPQKARSSFGIGASILRVANQMHCSKPTRLIPCSDPTSKTAAKNNGIRKSLYKKPKAEEAISERETSSSPNEMLLSPHATQSIDHQQAGELEQVSMEAPSTNLIEDSMLECKDLKESSKEEKEHEGRKEAANIAGEITVKDSNLAEQTINVAESKEQASNKNCSNGSDSCKEDVSAV
ncbi:unnamed protein product [Cochlearia groenlandica]